MSLGGLLGGARELLGGSTAVRLADYTDENLRSGFPGLRGLTGRPLRSALDGYLQRVVDRDFPEFGHAANPSSLRRWMAAYAAATSTSTSLEKIRDAATGGDTRPVRSTVQPYREVLERLMTDNGSAYRSHLHRAVCRRGWDPPPGHRPLHPPHQRQGRALHPDLTNRWAYGQTYQTSAERTAALAGWLHHYNHLRPPRQPQPTDAGRAAGRAPGEQRGE